MGLQLRDHIHWCDCSGQAIFLDEITDRYFRLPPASNEAFLALTRGDLNESRRNALDLLIGRGLLIRIPEECAIRSTPGVGKITGDYEANFASLPLAFSSVAALRAELRWGSRLKTKPLHDVLQQVRQLSGRRRRLSVDADLSSLVAGFSAAAYLTRSHDRCLVRAFATYDLCCRSGVSPQLIFGVVAHPFAAHCWVQLGGKALVGGAEHASLYTPILVLQ